MSSPRTGILSLIRFDLVLLLSTVVTLKEEYFKPRDQNGNAQAIKNNNNYVEKSIVFVILI